MKGGYHQIIAPSSIKQYAQLLNQYDNLISNSYYKSINLLLGQYLKINFNEDRSSKLQYYHDPTGIYRKPDKCLGGRRRQADAGQYESGSCQSAGLTDRPTIGCQLSLTGKPNLSIHSETLLTQSNHHNSDCNQADSRTCR